MTRKVSSGFAACATVWLGLISSLAAQANEPFQSVSPVAVGTPKPPGPSERLNPYQCLDVGDVTGSAAIHEMVNQKLLDLSPMSALKICKIAELLKRVGDYRAEEYYQLLIKIDPIEPAYEYFYGEYLRFFRGPWRPLYNEAGTHFQAALDKLAALANEGQAAAFDQDTKSKTQLGLERVYDSYGLALARVGADLPYDTPHKPLVSFASENIILNDTLLPGQFVDVRQFTSAALYTESAQQLNRPLTRTELRQIASATSLFHSSDRLQFSPGALPTVDILSQYEFVHDPNARTASRQGQFSEDLREQIGGEISQPVDAAPFADLFLRAGYTQGQRKGEVQNVATGWDNFRDAGFGITAARLIGPGRGSLSVSFDHQDYHPGYDIKQSSTYAADLAYLSSLYGSEQTTFNLGYVRQDINGGIFSARDRGREAYTGRIGQLFSVGPLTVFGEDYPMRGIRLYAAAASDRQQFDQSFVTDRDYRVGMTLTRIGDYEKHPVDVTIEPTLYTTTVNNDPTQNNAEYRTAVNVLYRLWDEERDIRISDGGANIYPSYVHLNFPLRQDIVLTGPNNYENFRLGARLTGRFFLANKEVGPAFTASIGYDFQRFYHLNKNLQLFEVRLAVGF
jgi:hypothetical protein